MKNQNKNKARLIFIAIGICIGLVLAETGKGGWKAWLLLGGTLFGRWLLGQIAGIFFADELRAIKKRLRLKDPVKRQIWRHKKEGHTGRFKDCRKPACAL